MAKQVPGSVVLPEVDGSGDVVVPGPNPKENPKFRVLSKTSFPKPAFQVAIDCAGGSQSFVGPLHGSLGAAQRYADDINYDQAFKIHIVQIRRTMEVG